MLNSWIYFLFLRIYCIYDIRNNFWITESQTWKHLFVDFFPLGLDFSGVLCGYAPVSYCKSTEQEILFKKRNIQKIWMKVGSVGCTNIF